jgi:polyisoprenoid-binding protein YceI
MKVFVTAMLILQVLLGYGQVYQIKQGRVSFTSDAPLELIQASSKKLAGIVNFEKGTFAFSLKVNSFEGFNNPLQKIHFNENYLESQKFESITFVGKIIEKEDFSKLQKYTIRAKGILTVHGIEKERIIKVDLEIGQNLINVSANFTVLLDDHEIFVPQIVNQKIAKEIKVNLNAEMTSKPNG